MNRLKKMQVLCTKMAFIVVVLVLISSGWALDPGAREDALAERQKVLRTADQVDGLVEDMGRLRQEVTALKQRITELSAQNTSLEQKLGQERADRLKEREILIAEVSKMVGQKPGKIASSTGISAHKNETLRTSLSASNASAATAKPTTAAKPTVSTTPLVNASASTPLATPAGAQATEKGYEHVVEQGQTLWLIAKAYRAQGVKVTVEDIRRANNLKKSDSIRTGQKLFIPAK